MEDRLGFLSWCKRLERGGGVSPQERSVPSVEGASQTLGPQKGSPAFAESRPTERRAGAKERGGILQAGVVKKRLTSL